MTILLRRRFQSHWKKTAFTEGERMREREIKDKRTDVGIYYSARLHPLLD